MKYLILAVVALFTAECALAQSTAPADSTKPVAKQPAPAADAGKQPVPAADAAKRVGTTDKTVAVDSYMKAQEKKKAAMEKKRAAKEGNSKTADVDSPVRPGSVMTDEERAEHRKQLHSFKTLDDCEKYEKDYQAKVEARAKEQHKTLRPFNTGACNRYKVAAGPAAPAVAKPAATDVPKPVRK